MTHRTIIALVAGIAAFVSTASASETLFCAGERSTGFEWDAVASAWTTVNFNVQEDRFVVAPDSGVENGYTIVDMGEKTPRHRCIRQVFEGFVSPQMVCGGMGFGVIVNFQTLRYHEIQTFGFVDGSDGPDNDPAMTIGRCSVISQ